MGNKTAHNLINNESGSFACLSSRFPYGEDITKEKLSMVDRAEQFLLDLGFRQVRVRIHGLIARIEILPSDFAKITEMDIRGKITGALHSYGFTYISLDLDGYRTGSMNETLNQQTVVNKFKCFRTLGSRTDHHRRSN